jgi:hypothetical protein
VIEEPGNVTYPKTLFSEQKLINDENTQEKLDFTVEISNESTQDKYKGILTASFLLQKNGGACLLIKTKYESQDNPPIGLDGALSLTLPKRVHPPFEFNQAQYHILGNKEIDLQRNIGDLHVELKGALLEWMFTDEKNNVDETQKMGYERESVPFVFTVATMKEGSPNDLKLGGVPEDNQPNSATNLVSALLIRTLERPNLDEQEDNINIKYRGFPEMDTNLGRVLEESLYPFQHLYVNIHLRSCLALQAARCINGEETDAFKTAAADFIGMVRTILSIEYTRWHGFMILTERLFKYLEKNANEQDNQEHPSGLRDQLKDLIDMRTDVALAFRNYATYTYTAGAANTLVHRIRSALNEDAMEESLRVLIETADRLYYDKMEWHRLSVLEGFNQK